jgi:soluble lytic murein transglycosylase-like protein
LVNSKRQQPDKEDDMTPALPRLRPRSAKLLPLVAAVSLLLSCTAKKELDSVSPTRSDSSQGYGTWRPALDAVPKTISDADAELYRRIYAHQQREEWAAADRLIAQLQDRSLVGHVLAARYLSTYRPSYAEVRNWMRSYADHPDANRIARLSSGNRGRPARKARRHRQDAEVDFDPGADDPVITTSRRPKPRPEARTAPTTRRGVGSPLAAYKLELRRGNLERAASIINSPAAERALGAVRQDAMRTELAIYALQGGQFDLAYRLSSAATRSRDAVPNAAWVAGLSGWKVGKRSEAAAHFEAVAGTARDNEWPQARAAYWAARAHQEAGDNAAARRWLERASQFPRTLYGMLARHSLGLRHEFNFSVAMQANPAHLSQIASSPGGKRAFGLIQIGMVHHAGEELVRHYKAQGETMDETYLAIADRGALPDLAYYVSAQLFTRTGRTYDPGLYPVPEWKPQGGFQLDRAVIFAIMRQESAFQTKVVSRANARGLMQLIPPTASLMAGDGRLRHQLGRLFDPEFNMELGQRYLRQLLKDNDVNGNIAFAAAAYNAGEGALAKWNLREDPLLFLATIPYTETREYVERVLYNLAAYRLRLGQNATELDDLSNNRWPIYRPQDR